MGNVGFELALTHFPPMKSSSSLNGPEVLNSFSSQLQVELRTAIRAANLDETVDILVLTGEGRAFGTGGDLKEFAAPLKDDDPLSVYRFEDKIPFHILREIEKTTIAAVNGICVAAGLIATMTSDISIAGSNATFCIPEGKVGLGDPFMPPLLYARVGMTKANYLMFTAATIDPAEAEHIGLVTETVPHEHLWIGSEQSSKRFVRRHPAREPRSSA